MPKSKNITINDSIKEISNFDQFTNTLKRRFTIFNIPKQKITTKTIEFKDHKINNENKDYYNDYNSWQIFTLINNGEYIFSETKIKMIKNKRKEIIFEEEFKKQMILFYKENKNIKNIPKSKKDEFFKDNFS